MEKASAMALDIEEGSVKAESGREIKMPVLPKSLSLEEKKFLLAVERGDLATVKKIIHRAKRHQHINLNCMDPMGRGALLMAIDNENLQMVELLVVMGIETKDALLHAIDKEFVEAVELLLEHEELIHKDGDSYSWEKVDRTTASFTPDITPLILAAHRNNYEILKILLDRGATLPMPHDVRCGCLECIRGVKEDSLRHSMSRINAYRALSSPSLIALSSTDPILTAFELSVELKNLAYAETEFRQEYMDLRRQCQEFACELLSHTRSSQELAILLNHDPNSPPYNDGEHMKLARLELAIDYKQKKFVAHPNIQQLLGAIWYEGLPGFRRKSPGQKMLEVVQIAVLFPVYCLLYIFAPGSSHAQLMRKPFVKFLIHASSYLFFLFLLILVSQRAEVVAIQIFGSESMKLSLADQLKRQRGNGPTFLECVVAFYVLGYICDEMKEMWREGMAAYCRNMWNFIDLSRNLAYSLVMILRVVAYFQQKEEIARNPATAYIPREEWDDYDPQLIAEGIFAMANIFSAIKLVHLFSINPYLGPLQISLGRMVIDIVKFFFIYSLVLFSFACGLNQLLWYFSDLERQKCYSLPDGLADWKNSPDSCLKWRRFANLFESSQSLFWASFGLVDLTNFELSGVKSYTRFWGLLMFGSYSVINVVVLLNLLIAMMSNSYSLITEHADTEWKFARSKLWMSYFELGSTLPPPFNLLPTPKDIIKWFGLRKKDKIRRMSSKRRQSHIRERDFRYAAVMRSLVWRYIIAMHRRQDMSEVTEDDVNEIKGDISTLRFELIEVFKKNGMDVSCASKNTQAALGRKMRIWERRLLRDFHVVSVAGEEDLEEGEKSTTSLNDPGDRFRRLAMMVVNNATKPAGPGSARNIKSLSHIGRSMSSESFKSSQNLRKAMEEAQRLTVMEPTPEVSPRGSPLPVLPNSGASVLELLQHIQDDDSDTDDKGSLSSKADSAKIPAKTDPPKESGPSGGKFGAFLQKTNRPESNKVENEQQKAAAAKTAGPNQPVERNLNSRPVALSENEKQAVLELRKRSKSPVPNVPPALKTPVDLTSTKSAAESGKISANDPTSGKRPAPPRPSNEDRKDAELKPSSIPVQKTAEKSLESLSQPILNESGPPVVETARNEPTQDVPASKVTETAAPATETDKKSLPKPVISVTPATPAVLALGAGDKPPSFPVEPVEDKIPTTSASTEAAELTVKKVPDVRTIKRERGAWM